MEKDNQEIIFKLSMYEQQIRQLQQQLQAIENGIIDLASLNSGLDELIDSKGKEILAPIGKGIFVKTKLLSEELIVDIGENTFVKKNIDDTKKLLDEQISKLEEVKVEIGDNLEKLGQEMTEAMTEMEKERENKK
jgi:prefoldin alpha subunit